MGSTRPSHHVEVITLQEGKYKLLFTLVSVGDWRKFIIELIFTHSIAIVKDVSPNASC
jgi:hypothetical protein